MNADDRCAILIAFLALLAVAAFWIGIAYVGWHFITKFW